MSVSVIIPAYDVAAVIERAIASVLAQTRPAHEIIVIDDGSSDTTGDVVRHLAAAHPRVGLITLETNSGPARARNVGIQAATGEWIGLLDADDTWAPARIEILLNIAVAQGADFVVDNIVFYDEVAGQVSRRHFEAPWRTQVIDLENLFRNHLPGATKNVGYGTFQPLVRRAFLRAHAIAYDENLRAGEDWKFNAEIVLSGAKAVVCNEPLYTYYQPIGGVSGSVSPHSRTPRRREDQLSQTVMDLKQKYGAVITPAVARAMDEKSAKLLARHRAMLAGE